MQEGLKNADVSETCRRYGIAQTPVALRRKESGSAEASQPNEIWQSNMTKVWARPLVGWASRTIGRAYHHLEGNSYIQRFRRSLKEGEARTAECRAWSGGGTDQHRARDREVRS